MNPDISSTRISFSTVKHLPRFTVTNQLIVVLQAHRRVLVMTVQMIEALEAQKLNQFRRGLNILWDLRIFFHPTQKFLFFIFFSYISVVQILELSIVLLIEIPAHSSCCQHLAAPLRLEQTGIAYRHLSLQTITLDRCQIYSISQPLFPKMSTAAITCY